MINAKIKAQNQDANLRSYDEIYKKFSWSEAQQSFTWHKTGRVNIVHEAVDRWAEDSQKADCKALIFEKAGKIKTFTYKELKDISCCWANFFDKFGFKTGDRLFIFLPPCPEIYFAMLACARMGVLFCPLFSTLNTDELEDRLKNAKPRGILTTPDLEERLPGETMSMTKHIFLVSGPLPGLFSEEVPVEDIVKKMPPEFETIWVPGHTPLYLLFTSGSTGPPKGVVHAHHDMTGHLITARYVLNLNHGSILWADCYPAWVTGTVYGAFAPWLCCATSVVQGDPFSASSWYRTLETHKVSAWYLTPGTMNKLKDAGRDLVHRYDLSHLAHISSVGESLAPELIYWFKENFKVCPHDNWWMTETGMICIANFPSMDIKPGAMGKPVPGIKAAVIDENGKPLPPLTMGELALKPAWPALMTGIWKDESRYREYFRLKGWFLTGDMVIQDKDGYIYHQGRIDDLIKVGVKLVGPYEIERALFRHPAVKEAAVISKPSRLKEASLKAFITINSGFTPSTRLKLEIKAFVKANLSSDIPLDAVVFLDKIPKTRSGKLLRRILRTSEMGLPIGESLQIKDY